jgi:hypothetical protein
MQRKSLSGTLFEERASEEAVFEPINSGANDHTIAILASSPLELFRNLAIFIDNYIVLSRLANRVGKVMDKLHSRRAH